MPRFVKSRVLQELVIYLGIAGLATVINLAVAVIAREAFHVQFNVSVVIGYGTGMIVGFVLTKRFAFASKNSDSTLREFIKFTLVTLPAFGVTYVTAILVKRAIEAYFISSPEVHAVLASEVSRTGLRFINRDLLAQCVGIGLGFFVNFFGHKLFTFRSSGMWTKMRTSRPKGGLPLKRPQRARD